MEKAIVELSKIERVELREVWPNEADDFTPWLAENLSQLGEALGLDLDIRGTEVPVGSYSLDILANDIGSDRPVIIENQLEKTDHSHLGQILTYGAGHDADTIVWIAKEFSDEHRAALDYLNGRTGEDTKFFGVVVEVWKIDDSRPAVNFDLVATPNEWRKESARKARDSGTSEKGEKYRTFWQPLIDEVRGEHQFTGVKQASTRSFCSFLAGHGLGGVKYNVSFAQGGGVRIEVYIDRGAGKKEWNKRLFDNLEKHKKTIESETCGSFSCSWEWERLDDYRACRISAIRPGTIDDDDKTLEEIRRWMITGLLAFKKDVFGPRLAKLVPKMDELAE